MNMQQNRDEDVPEYNVDLDGTPDQSASRVVVNSIADLTDRDPADLELLWDSVDPDALDSFVAHARESSTPYQLSFRYQGYSVTVENKCLRFLPIEEVPSSASV